MAKKGKTKMALSFHKKGVKLVVKSLPRKQAAKKLVASKKAVDGQNLDFAKKNLEMAMSRILMHEAKHEKESAQAAKEKRGLAKIIAKLEAGIVFERKSHKSTRAAAGKKMASMRKDHAKKLGFEKAAKVKALVSIKKKHNAEKRKIVARNKALRAGLEKRHKGTVHKLKIKLGGMNFVVRTRKPTKKS